MHVGNTRFSKEEKFDDPPSYPVSVIAGLSEQASVCIAGSVSSQSSSGFYVSYQFKIR